MSERESTTLLGAPAGTPEGIEEIDEMKATIVRQLTECGVKFPINSKRELSDIYPFGTPIKCRYRGRDTSIHDIIKDLSDSDFPIKNAGDAATLLASRCEITPGASSPRRQ
ncbi:MAG: MTH865-like family protein [Methanocella sp. PtaU1.Bin125]|nr:MAG: MTH865-like family protein [Methanocella sp. PtaU1.Bin125]